MCHVYVHVMYMYVMCVCHVYVCCVCVCCVYYVYVCYVYVCYVYVCNYQVAFISPSGVFERIIKVTIKVFRKRQHGLGCPCGCFRCINPCDLYLPGGRSVCDLEHQATRAMKFTMTFTAPTPTLDLSPQMRDFPG